MFQDYNFTRIVIIIPMFSLNAELLVATSVGQICMLNNCHYKANQGPIYKVEPEIRLIDQQKASMRA